jgi:hypothetical protein
LNLYYTTYFRIKILYKSPRVDCLTFSFHFFKSKAVACWVPVAHACNHSYSGGRNQEHHGSKPTGAKKKKQMFTRPYLKKPFTKMGLVEWLKVQALSSSPSTAKKKKKK